MVFGVCGLKRLGFDVCFLFVVSCLFDTGASKPNTVFGTMYSYCGIFSSALGCEMMMMMMMMMMMVMVMVMVMMMMTWALEMFELIGETLDVKPKT